MIKGIRTDCVTGEAREVEVNFSLTPIEDNFIFTLLNGPTGYEAFYLNERTVKKLSEIGWIACIGTPGKWDRLFISAEEMKKAFEYIGWSVPA